MYVYIYIKFVNNIRCLSKFYKIDIVLSSMSMHFLLPD